MTQNTPPEATSAPERSETDCCDCWHVRAILGLPADADVVAAVSRLKERVSELAGENTRLRGLLKGLTGMELDI